jgi:hypothetical protein
VRITSVPKRTKQATGKASRTKLSTDAPLLLPLRMQGRLSPCHFFYETFKCVSRERVADKQNHPSVVRNFGVEFGTLLAHSSPQKTGGSMSHFQSAIMPMSRR